MSGENENQEISAPCANNCGFYGSAATLNYCSKCFNQKQMKKGLTSSSPSSPVIASSESVEERSVARSGAAAPASSGAEDLMVVGRCSACRKKVGLLGFKCRCGMAFCGIHRYPEKHACNLDHKGKGRAEIERANPLYDSKGCKFVVSDI